MPLSLLSCLKVPFSFSQSFTHFKHSRSSEWSLRLMPLQLGRAGQSINTLYQRYCIEDRRGGRHQTCTPINKISTIAMLKIPCLRSLTLRSPTLLLADFL